MTHLLVDGNGLVCRLWWANPAAVVDRFTCAIEKTKIERVRVAWDSSSSWRRDLFPDYKRNRPPKPRALVEALEKCRAPFEALEAKGFEADDCIATVCRRALLNGDAVVVMSEDKDMAQLAGARCWWLARGKMHGPAEVTSRIGVPPDRIRHLLSWMGDAVDGLPGVPGYGRKRALVKAWAGEIGNELTFDLVELATVVGLK